MPFPEYIPTRPVSVGGAMVLESSDLLKVRVTITASKSLVWDATGYRFEKLKVSSTSELGSEVLMNLPRTDVQGWRDPAVNAVIDVSAEGSFTHRYTALVEFLDAGDRSLGIRPVTLGPFTVPAGEGTIDLDKTVPASTVSGELVMVPDLWGQLVAAAEAAALEAQAALVDSTEFVRSQVAEPGPVRDELNTAFVRFTDQNGDPLPPGSVTTIVIDTTNGEIDDIIFEEA